MPLTDVNSAFPRLKLNSTVETRQMIGLIKQRSGFVASDVVGMIYELRDVLMFYLKFANSVKLEGIGIFSPTVKLDGTINIKFKPDKSLVMELNNNKDHLKPRITNRKNLGKSLDQIQNPEIKNEG